MPHEALPLSVEVSQVDSLLLATVDTRHRASDLPGDESGTTARALMVEEDPVGQMHSVCLRSRKRDGDRDKQAGRIFAVDILLQRNTVIN